MAIYLIDYENVKNLTGIGRLSSQDKVVIFYSKNANSVTFETMQELNSSKATIEYKDVTVGGQNALDFQLASYLGYLIKEYGSASYYIVSKDKGFSYIVNFWKTEKNLEIGLFTDLTGKTQYKEAEEQNNTIVSSLKQSALSLKETEIKEIARVVSQFKTKQAINNNLMNVFRDSEKVGKIIKIIKPFIKDKK